MDFLIDNWYVIIGVIVSGGCLGCAIYRFCFEPRTEQLEEVKEWLKFAVYKAEKELGSGTGQLKLRFVYDMFVERFPWTARVISFNTFSDWVREALEWLGEQLKSNKNVKELVNENK